MFQVSVSNYSQQKVPVWVRKQEFWKGKSRWRNLGNPWGSGGELSGSHWNLGKSPQPPN